jgi:hypothetical protein
VSEMDKWVAGEYPYDQAECGFCATMHRKESDDRCTLSKHAEMRKEAKRLWGAGFLLSYPEFRAAVLAFREKFDRFYPTPRERKAS